MGPSLVDPVRRQPVTMGADRCHHYIMKVGEGIKHRAALSPVGEPVRQSKGPPSLQGQGDNESFNVGGKASRMAGACRSLEGRLVPTRAALSV